MNTLSTQQRKYLKGLAHTLKPVVTIGSDGLSPGVVEELSRNIAHHELMKIKLPAGDKAGRESMLNAACDAVGAAAVTLIGRTGIMFRAGEKPRIRLPK